MNIKRMLDPEKLSGLSAIFYNAVSAKALMNIYDKVAEEVIKKVDNGRILDLGTGPGHLPIKIAKLNHRLYIVGADISPSAIAIAQRNAKLARTNEIKFEVADAHNLPHKANSFDLIVSTISLHHWRESAKVFSECLRVLKNGGIALIYDLRRDSSYKEVRKTIGYSLLAYIHLLLVSRIHGLFTQEYLRDVKESIKQARASDFTIDKMDACMRIQMRKCK